MQARLREKYKNGLVTVCLATLAALTSPPFAQSAGPPHCTWEEGFTVAGLDGEVTAIVSRTTPSGPEVYVGGEFRHVDGKVANHVARWTENGWEVLAGPDGTGMDAPVTALAFWDDGTGPRLFAGGGFETAGGIQVNHVAQWTGGRWSPVGDLATNNSSEPVAAMVSFADSGGSALYVAGGLGSLGAAARWDGSSWTSIPNAYLESHDAISALSVADESTGFGLLAATDRGSVLELDNGTWMEIAPPPEFPRGAPTALAAWFDGSGPKVYIGGQTVTSLSGNNGYVLEWDGEEWHRTFGYSTSLPDQGEIRDLLPAFIGGESRLFATGSFRHGTDDEPLLNHVASWDGSTWHPLPGPEKVGLSHSASALAVVDEPGGSALLVGGEFLDAGDTSAQHIAKWSDAGWSTLSSSVASGNGVDQRTYAFAEWDDGGGLSLYAGGAFLTASGRRVNHIARWNGTAWDPLEGPAGIGTDGPVYALAVFDDGSGPALYAGGQFATAGGVAANNIARWDGQTWTGVGSGVGATDSSGSGVNDTPEKLHLIGLGPRPQVRTLAVWDDGNGPGLFAGGFFRQVGESDAQSIARWDGEVWQALPTAVQQFPPIIRTLKVWDDGLGESLFVGGVDLTVDQHTQVPAARWDGQEWHALDPDSPLMSGIVTEVRALEVWDDGTGPALHAAIETQLARWTGQSWIALAEFPDSPISALETWNGRLYAAVSNLPYIDGTADAVIASYQDSNWWPIDGQPDDHVDTLFTWTTSRGTSLLAGGAFNQLGTTPSAHLGHLSCDDSADTSKLRLVSSRFVAQVSWRDFEGNSGTGQVVPFQTNNSGVFYFFDADNWELLVKVLDACSFNDHVWVFSAATTNVEYTLTVTDAVTGTTKSYFNPLGVAAPSITDTQAFATCSDQAADPTNSTGVFSPHSPADSGIAKARAIGDVQSKNGCVASDTMMCLDGGRFALEIDWRDFEGAAGSGFVVEGTPSDDSGLFQFFGAENWEVLVKVLDACSFNERFWVFSAATTNVEYTLKVTDTETGEAIRYFNPLGNPADAVTDTDAFATCP